MLNKKYFFTFLVCFFLFSFLNEAHSKTLTIGISQEPNTLNPLLNTMTTGFEIIGLINRGLTVWDNDWNLVPDLAEEIPSIKNKGVVIMKNGSMKVFWRLKKDLKWSDGIPLTPEDFIYSHNLHLDKKIPVPSRTFDDLIEKMEGSDPRTLVVTWKIAFPYFDSFSVHPVLPKHIIEKRKESEKENFYNSFGSIQYASNGPFKLLQWIPGVKISFDSNEYFYGSKPKIASVVYKIIPSISTIEANLISGVIDAVSVQDVSYDQAIAISERYKGKIEMVSRSGMVFEHIVFNLDDPWLKDKRVRKAIISAIDRETIVKTLFNGGQDVAHTWLHPKHYGFNPSLDHYKYDTALSKKLFKEAGFITGEDGFLHDKEGKKMRLVIMSPSGNRMREQIETIIQSYLKAVGVELEIDNKHPKLFFSEYLQKRKFPHLALYAIKSNPNTDGVILWTKGKIPSQENNWEGQNYPGFRNEESDRLILKVPKTFSLAKRAELLKKSQEIWVSELPAIPLFYRNDVCLRRAGLKGFEPTGNITPSSWNAQDWDIQNSN